VDGHFDYALPVAIFYSQVFFHPAYLFPLFAPFLVLGVWFMLKQSRENLSAAILLLGWSLLSFLFLAGIPYENFRFGLGFLTPVVVLAGIGVGWAFDHVPIALPWRTGLVLLIMVALAGSAYWETRVLQPVLAQKEIELNQGQWLSERVPTNATIFAFGVNDALRTYTPLHVADLQNDSTETIVAHAHSLSPAYLFINVTNVETQWKGRPFQQMFHVLRDEVGLEEQGTIDEWTLFRIGAAP
jgi:hypothetical protein